MRWRFQFSLRMLLAFVSVVAVACSWAGWRLALQRAEDRIIAELREQGADVKIVEPGASFVGIPISPGSVVVHFSRCEADLELAVQLRGLESVGLDHLVTPSPSLRPLLRAKRLHTLRLSKSYVEDDELVTVGALDGLVNLFLAGEPNITNEGVRHLAALEHLRVFCINGTQVTDDGLRHFSSFNELMGMSVIDCNISGHGLVHLKGLSKLHVLTLVNNQLDGSGLSHLEHLDSLRRLELARNPIDDDAMKGLAKVKQLESLDLRNTLVTDEGLPHLAELPSLFVLQLGGTAVTSRGIAELKALLPSLNIQADPEPSR